MYAASSLFAFTFSALIPVLGTPRQELRASDGLPYDQLGEAVTSIGNYVLLGAPYSDAMGDDSGATYVFYAHDGSEVIRLFAPDGLSGDKFGADLSTYTFGANGERLNAFIGAPGALGGAGRQGAVYCMEVDTGQQLLRFTASDGQVGDQFGLAVSARRSADQFFLVGAPGHDALGLDAGAAYTYGMMGNNERKLLADDASPGDCFGCSVSLDGSISIVGARRHDGAGTDAGAAYVFKRDDELERLQPDDLTSGDQFGSSVAVDGRLALVGAPGADHNGPNSGAAYLFISPADTYMPAFSTTELRLLPDDGAAGDRFGVSVDIQHGVAIVGTEAGAAYLFNARTGEQIDKLLPQVPGTTGFGRAVAIADGTAVVGMPLDTVNGSRSGAAQTFDAVSLDALGTMHGVDGSSPVDCPCGNAPETGSRSGCVNSTGIGATLEAHGSSTLMRDDLYFEVKGAPAERPGVILQGSLMVSMPFGDGLLRVGGSTERLMVLMTDANGEARSSESVVNAGDLNQRGYQSYQFWYRDSAGANCSGSNLTNAVRILWL